MRCGSVTLPDTVMDGAKILDPAAAGQAIRQLLARTETTETRALVAVSDALATFRTLYLPVDATDQDVHKAVAQELSLEPERIVRRWMSVGETDTNRVVYAVAWDREQVRSVTEAVRLAGLETAIVDLKSSCLTRTTSEQSCVILDLAADPAEIVLVNQYLPQLWHSFRLPASTNDDLAPALASPLRSVLRFHERGRDPNVAASAFPVLVSSEQILSPQALTHVSELIEQPVRPLPAPPRVAPHVRHSTYLTCIGLIMRRR